MNGPLIAILFLASLFVVGGGTFYGGILYGSIPQTSKEVPAYIVEEAKKNVPLPKLPPKPAGKTVVEPKEISQTIRIPSPTLFEPGRTVEKKITTTVPNSKLVDATPEEISAWDASVKKLEEEYNKKLSAEIDKISRQNAIKSAKDFAAAIKEVSSDVIIPIIFALTGIVGAIVSLKSAFKAKSNEQ